MLATLTLALATQSPAAQSPAAPVPASAVTAYTCLAKGGLFYSPDDAYAPNGKSRPYLYFRFVATATGAFAAFSGAVNNTLQNTVPVPFTLSLFADGPGPKIGKRLASYPGKSTGQMAGFTVTALSTVIAKDGPRLVAGQAYWVGVAPSSEVCWAHNIAHQIGWRTYGKYAQGNVGAFSVSVVPTP